MAVVQGVVLNLDSVRDIINEIARENGIQNYKLDVNEQEFNGRHYSSKIYHVKIVTEDGKNQKLNLLVKLAETTTKEARKNFEEVYKMAYKTELLAYTKALPVLDEFQKFHCVPTSKCFKYPKFYRGGCDEFKEFMMLEDLSTQGYEMYKKMKPLDYDYCIAIVETLARYHAISFAMKERNPQKFEQIIKDITFSNFPKSVAFAECMDSIINNLFNMIAPQINCDDTRQIIQGFISNSKETWRKCLSPELTAPYNIICHGDQHLGNMLFKASGTKPEVRFVDWQWTNFGSPMIDLVHNIYQATIKTFRDQNLQKVYNTYYHTLGESLAFYGCDVKKLYPRDVFEKHLKLMTPHGLLLGISGCMMQLGKTYREKNMEALTTSTGKLIASDTMIERLKEIAEDITLYETHLNK